MNITARSLRIGRKRRGLSRPLIIMAVAALLAAAIPTAAANEPEFVPNPHPHSVVVDWMDTMLEAIELNPPAPTATTWRMWVVTSSIYDAWSAYDVSAMSTQTGYDLKRPASERTEANQRAAVSYAAHRALTFVFPNQAPMFDDVLDALGYAPSASMDVTTPAGIGNVSAQAVIDYRIADGSNATGGFAQVVSATYPTLYSPVNSGDPTASNGPGGVDYDVNRWQPLRVANGTLLDENGNPTYDHNDPSTYTTQNFLTPHWGAVTPFALTSGDQFRPQAPPQLGSTDPYVDAFGNVSTGDAAFRSQVAEVLDFSANLTDEDKVNAEFWADGPHTWTPPGHWVQLAIGVSLRDGHTIGQDAEMYMALTGAVLDAGITAWEAKRFYDFARPVTAIRSLYAGQQIMAWGGPNQGTQLIDGADFQPYQSLTFVTPPFAEYISGHSTFSRASAEVLTAFTGSGAMYDGVTGLGRDYDGDGQEDLFGQHVAVPGTLQFEDGPAQTVTLTWDTFIDAANEAGISRLYGGIHFQDGDRFARAAGANIGKQAFQWAQLFWNPFGEISQTVTEQSAAGQLKAGSQKYLAAQANVAKRHFEAGRTTSGCASLGNVDRYLDKQRGKGVGEAAFQIFDRQVAQLVDSLCS